MAMEPRQVNKMKRYASLCLTFLVVLAACHPDSGTIAAWKADVDKLQKEEVITAPDGIPVTVAYKASAVKFKAVTGEEYFLIDYAYFILNGQIAGRIDLTGIYDKTAKLIYRINNYHQYAGISSSLIKYPGSPMYVYKKGDRYIIDNTAASITFDLASRTVGLFVPNL